MDSETYDIVIIGGGTAGLVLASRLSDDPDLHIAVVESGEDRMTDTQVRTPGMWALLANTAADRAFCTVPQKELGDKEIVFPQGRVLGGSSGINSLLFTPTSKATVEAWAQLGNEGWDYASFEKAVRKIYTLHKPSGITEGNGPLQLTAVEPETLWEKAWIGALESI